MTVNPYIFKRFENNSYDNYTENLVSIPYTPLLHFSEISDKHSFTYDTTQIPQKTLGLLDKLLEIYSVNEFREEFTSLLIFVQSMYIEYNDSYSDELIQMFIEEDKEYQNLLDIIEQYLFSEKNKLQSIRFNFLKNDTKTTTIRNATVIDNIIRSICKSLAIDKDNFYERKNEILENSTLIKPNKGGDYVRMLLVKSLFDFLKIHIQNTSENQRLKFCGYFLHLCQIPYHQKITEIQVEDIENELGLIEPSVLRNFVERPNQVYTK
ncbi:MAG: hypothetical protein KF704_05930 [Crocinitomicaceae bacterium]|nr:hypothetical protein [Crocinitomicaceae bacterium]